MASALDIKTLIFVYSVALFFQALCMHYIRRVHADYAPTRLWAHGSLILALGMALRFLHSVILEFVSVVIANSMIVGGQMLLIFGVSVAAGQRPPWRGGGLLLAVFVSIYAWAMTLGLQQVSLAQRTIIFTLFTSINEAYLIYVCLRSPRDAQRTSFMLLGAVNLALLGALVYRAMAIQRNGLESPFQATPEQILLLCVSIFSVFASCALFAIIAGERLQKELRLLATRDPLTQVLNRRAFAELAEREWASAVRHKRPISTMMLDIDHFKKINDECGHATGDQVLVSVAQEIQTQLRQTDILARYGGEEFAVMLPDTHLSQAQEVAERIRQRIAQLHIPALDQAVTISIGLANHHHENHWAKLLNLSDQALYRAKQDGRNRVSIA